MAIVLLVKTFYTQITIRCNMTTGKKIRAKKWWPETGKYSTTPSNQYCYSATPLLSGKSLEAPILRFTYVIHKVKQKAFMWRSITKCVVCARARSGSI